MRPLPAPPPRGLPALALLLLPAVFARAPIAGDEPPPSPRHWAFVAPARATPPAVRDEAWPRGPLDRFLLARMESEGVTPSPEAPRATLIRRLSLDLTGLPPSVEEVEAFEADDRPDAYERVVERLLASPHFGEREALEWLDLARYADTSGYLTDPERPMWKWRDWLVESFNANKPFDRMTIELLAGDLLPDATLEQRIATAFVRLHPVTGEEDGQPGEYRHRYVSDRVRTTSTIWMGLTLACAECHDHKFEPLSQAEYYSFYAFFDNATESGLLPGDSHPRPFLRLPDGAQAARLLELESALEAQERLARAGEADAEAARAEWLAELRAGDAPRSAPPAVSIPLEGDAEDARVRGIGHASWVDGVRGRALRLEGDDAFVDCGDVASFSADEPFTVSAWVRAAEGPLHRGGSVIAKVDESEQFRGYALGIGAWRPYFDLRSSYEPMDAIVVDARDELSPGRWHHLAATYDGSRTREGVRLYVDGAPAALAPASPGPPGPAAAPEEVDEDGGDLEGPIRHDESLRIGCTDAQPFRGVIDEVRVFESALTEPEIRAMVEADLRAVARREGPLDPHAALLLRDYHRERVSPGLGPVLERQRAIRADQREAMEGVPRLSVMSERAERRPTRLLVRGDHSRPGRVVEPGVPAVLPALDAGDAPVDRLALARWLVRDDHPLVGRVTVNRVWARLFGAGLVETLDDLGTRGAAPSHPALLDWLAREFVDGGWDHKALVRTLVCSSAYRQSSGARADLADRDPANRLFARVPRIPLPAEVVRDNALAIAGLLDRRLLGPSVRPWQPEGLWAAASTLPGVGYRPSPVADRYRRGLYVHAKRAAPFASFSLFDAPVREVCVVQRTRTNTPLQALVLLNDRVYVEAARGLAQSLLELEASDAERLTRGFRAAVARAPEAAELGYLTALLCGQRAQFAADPEGAARYVAIGDLPAPDGVPAEELAAWTGVGAVLLGLDETITRE